jgi:uncharacterized delta-60 repeat protein
MRAAFIGVLVFATILLFSCGGSGTAKLSPHNTQTLSSALTELQQMAVPKGANPVVFEQLRAALRSALIARGDGKITSTPPTGVASTIPDLALTDRGDGTMDLTWSYYSIGDYNQDGKVDVADITPLAMRYGQGWTTADVNTLAAVADGSGNGTVDIADITQIAMNFGVEVDHYSVETSPTAGSGYSELVTQDITTGAGAATKRMHFTYNFTPAAGNWYRVVPHDSVNAAGVASNEVQAPADRTPWAHTFGDSFAESANAIAVDNSGNTYAVGSTDSFGAGNSEALIQKYSPSGMPLWRKTWGGPETEECYAVCVDGAGDIYVAGSSDSFGSGSDDAYVLKYASDGTLLWQRSWEVSGATYANAIAVDNLGFVYVTGDTNAPGAGMYDIFLLKYSTAGTLQWQKAWGGALDDYATAIAIDTSGNVDIAGSTMSFGVSGDVVVLQYSPDGTLLWQKTWGGIEGESAYAIDTDSSDSVFVAGYASNVGGGIVDVCVVKLSSAGALQWQAAWGGAGPDIANALCVDGGGNAWVVGSSSSFSAGSNDVFLLEYSGAGAPLLQRIWGGSDAEFAKGVFVDNSGMAYVSGAAFNALSSWFIPFGIETVLTYTDAIPGGTEGTPTGIEGIPAGIEIIPATGVEDAGGGGYDALVMKIDPLVI